MKKARPTNPPAVSRERTLYLRRKRRRTHLVHACQIGFLVFFFAQWEISARLGWIDSFILSQPSRILETLRNMSQNHLMMHVGVTLYETLTGFVLGVLLGVRFLIIFLSTGSGSGHIQSLILCAALLMIGVQVIVAGVQADLISDNRKLLEDVQYRVRKMEIDRAGEENKQ